MHTIFQHALSKISRVLQIEILVDASTKLHTFDKSTLRMLGIVDYCAKYAAELSEIDVGNCTQFRNDDMSYGFTNNISLDFHEVMQLPESYAEIFKHNYTNLSGYFDHRYNEYNWMPSKLKWHMYPQSTDETINIPTPLVSLLKAKKKSLRRNSCQIRKKYIKAPLKYYHKDVCNDFYFRFDSVSEILPAWDKLMKSGRYVGIRAFIFRLRNTHEYLKIRQDHDRLYANQMNRFITEDNLINFEKRLDWIFISLGHVVTMDLYLSCLIKKIKNKYDPQPEDKRWIIRENAGIFKIL